MEFAIRKTQGKEHIDMLIHWNKAVSMVILTTQAFAVSANWARAFVTVVFTKRGCRLVHVDQAI